MSLYGVGPVLGSQLIAEIGDVSRFSNKKALVGFAGIDAPPFQSGNFNPQSRKISKRGSAALRKTLFQTVILQNAPPNEPVFLFMSRFSKWKSSEWRNSSGRMRKPLQKLRIVSKLQDLHLQRMTLETVELPTSRVSSSFFAILLRTAFCHALFCLQKFYIFLLIFP